MTRVSPLFRFMPYGAPELLDAGRPNMARALVLASAVGALAFALLGLLRSAYPTGTALPPEMTSVTLCCDDPPPALLPFEESSQAPGGGITPNTGNSIDDIVPDFQAANSTMEFDPDAIGVIGAPTEVTGGEVVLDNRAPAETLPARGVFVNVEMLPEVLRQIEPVYPELPKQLNLSGFVLVHILVGRDGRVVNTVVDEKKNDPMFNEAALAAARGFVFRPAYNNGRTVAVWVTQGFRFTSR